MPENMHVSIITGKVEPKLEHINPYLRPTVDVGVIGWERGICLSRTALYAEGRIIELAFPLNPLSNWDPLKMLPTEAMHNVFEGLGKYYSWEVLTINLADAKKLGGFVAAFNYEFTSFDPESPTIPAWCRPKNDAAEQDISAIHRLLVSPLREESETHSEDEMHFSKAETHMGNSLVSYLHEGKTWFRSIEKIKVTPQGSVSFAIRHQEPLPPGKNDPFQEFPHFPARTYLSKMAETLADMPPSKVLGHYACFNFSGGRAVVLDLRRLAKVSHSTVETVCSMESVAPHRASQQDCCALCADPWRPQLAQQSSDLPQVSIAWRGFQLLL
ncbi:hypothetical protein B0H19DRAFT_1081640 [Mycena capillaripes]|nr:hypothetical protein B0H19DRAFT_1081640 [Mycena capillaripes]